VSQGGAQGGLGSQVWAQGGQVSVWSCQVTWILGIGQGTIGGAEGVEVAKAYWGLGVLGDSGRGATARNQGRGWVELDKGCSGGCNGQELMTTVKLGTETSNQEGAGE